MLVHYFSIFLVLIAAAYSSSSVPCFSLTLSFSLGISRPRLFLSLSLCLAVCTNTHTLRMEHWNKITSSHTYAYHIYVWFVWKKFQIQIYQFVVLMFYTKRTADHAGASTAVSAHTNTNMYLNNNNNIHMLTSVLVCVWDLYMRAWYEWRICISSTHIRVSNSAKMAAWHLYAYV